MVIGDECWCRIFNAEIWGIKMFSGNDKGFTLIEVIIALAVFSFGVLATLMMQGTVVRGNANAHRVTDATNWGGDRLEILFNMPYDSEKNNIDDDGVGETDDYGKDPDEFFVDTTGGGIDDIDADRDSSDGSKTSPDGLYNIHWNVVEDYPESNMKMIRVFVSSERLTKPLTFTSIKVLNK